MKDKQQTLQDRLLDLQLTHEDFVWARSKPPMYKDIYMTRDGKIVRTHKDER